LDPGCYSCNFLSFSYIFRTSLHFQFTYNNCVYLLVTVLKEDPKDQQAQRSVHSLVLHLLTWAKRNNASNQSVDELLKLLSPFLAERASHISFPQKQADALKIFKPFLQTLKIHELELCKNGCYRFEEDTIEAACPECLTPRRLPDGQRTTCTFAKFNLKDKLRLLYSRPNLVALLKSHSTIVPEYNAAGERLLHGVQLYTVRMCSH